MEKFVDNLEGLERFSREFAMIAREKEHAQ